MMMKPVLVVRPLAMAGGCVALWMAVAEVSAATAAATDSYRIAASVLHHDLPSSLGKRKLQAAAQRLLEFGDYAEYPDTCPYMTSCPAICVANETDCPTACGPGLQLCETGICLEDCAAEKQVVENPCACEGRPFACAKVIDIFETCFDRFQSPYYDDNAACLEAQVDALPQVDFRGPIFRACYWILGIVFGLVVLWCAFNTYIPVTDSSVVMNHTNTKSSNTDNDKNKWTLTGYKHHPVGMFIYAGVIMTLLGIQFLLFLLVIFYYMQQEAITRWGPVFYDEVQVLKAFQIVWMVGFFWSFAFRYPSSIRDLFLRRCALSSATFVAVMAPTKHVESEQDATPGYGERVMAAFWMPFDAFLRLVFSYHYNKPGYEIVFCPVETDVFTGKRGFYYRMRRFVYDHDDDGGKNDESSMSFIPGTIEVGETLGAFFDQSQGLSTEEAQKRLGLTGPNGIPMPKPTVLGSIVQEFSQPFYLYQNFMVWTWAPYWYYYMAIVNSVVRVTGGVIVGVFQYMSDSVLYQLSNVEGSSTVIRDGNRVEIANVLIAPGDVVVLKPGVVCCDMVVLQAGRLTLDESALTGEPNSVVKSEIDPTLFNDKYDPHRHKSFTLSAGTEILEVGDDDGKALGLVLATGSFTTKGKLVTDVLSYQRHKFKFDDEVKMVLCILVAEAIFLVGMVFSFIRGEQWVYAWFYAIFVLGTVIPPLLPTVFVVSVGISAKRLQAKRITCTYQEGILIAGKVDSAFFDKTGTLTKQGMDFISLDAEGAEMEEMAKMGMSVCHTLHTASDGQLVGNNIDTVSFRFTNSELIQNNGSQSQVKFRGHLYTIVKQFEFDSHRQTQSVIVKEEDGKMTVFVKGSPEAIRALCTTGVPLNFDETLGGSAKAGVYQLAIAFRRYNAGNTELENMTRAEAENNLQFAAFLSFQNSMRDETPEVIKELVEGDVSVTMVTGDSVLTGIFIAKSAGMIQAGHQVQFARKTADGEIQWIDAETDIDVAPPTENTLRASSVLDLAVTGEAWTTLLKDDPKYASTIANRIRVFGRCNPSDKVAVLTHFVEQGQKTLMAGDGGNDMGALKSAHVGIALSTAEASVVAPFTSLDKEITAVTEVLREGRCALASAFSAYSYYIIYGQAESFLQVINAYFAITFTEWCWVFMDGIWSTLMAFSLPLARAAKKLSPSRPTASLLGPRTMTSVCGIITWNFIFLVVALAVLWRQDWFQCRKWNSEDVSDVKSIGDNYETSVLFLVGGYQYIASAIALNFGYQWRENFMKNYVFVFLALVFSVMHFVATVYPSEFSCIWRINCDNEDAVRWVTTPYPVAISNPWNTTVMPVEFRWKLVGIMAGNLLVLCLWQYLFVNGLLATKLSTITTTTTPVATPSAEGKEASATTEEVLQPVNVEEMVA